MMVEVAAMVAVSPQQEAVAGGLETCNHSNNLICLCLNPIPIPNVQVIQLAPHMRTHRDMLVHIHSHAHTYNHTCSHNHKCTHTYIHAPLMNCSFQ